MGMFTDRMVANVNDHVVEVEARTSLLGFEYDLIVDNARVDRSKGLFGVMTLRGLLEAKPVVVTIRQGLLGTKYPLDIGGQEYKMQKVR